MRTKMMKTLLGIASFVAGSSLFSVSAYSLPGYTFTDIGTLGGQSLSGEQNAYAFSINNSGQVVGGSYTVAGQYHAFLYESGVMSDLGTLGGSSSSAYDINDYGHIVGYSRTTPDSNEWHAFLYKNEIMADLGTLGGIQSVANGINNNGQIVGFSTSSEDGHRHGFLYENGIMTDIGSIGGGSTTAQDINDAGQIVGWTETWSPTYHQYHGFIYEDGAFINIGKLNETDKFFSLEEINNSGQVVGFVEGDDYSQAFLYENGEIKDIGVPVVPDEMLGAYGNNNSGQIVGSMISSSSDLVDAFLYDRGDVINLNELFPENLLTAQDINDKGQIIGRYLTDSNGDGRMDLRAYLLDPTWDAVVTTEQSYITDYMTLGDTLNFGAWWEMDEAPQGKNVDILVFRGEKWEVLGWDLAFDESSTEWETISFAIPKWARGLETRIQFKLYDFFAETDPVVYLRDINSAPVPEPATLLLLGIGLVGLAGVGRNNFRKSNC